MTINLLNHDQTVREDSGGTGAAFVTDAAGGVCRDDRASYEQINVFGFGNGSTFDVFNLKSFLRSFGLCAAAGGAVIVAIFALSVAYGSIDQLDRFREQMASIDANVLNLPALKNGIEAVTAEQAKIREAGRTQIAAIQAIDERVTQAEVGLRQSIQAVDNRMLQITEKSRESEAALGLRLDRIEFSQTAHSTDLPIMRPSRESVGRVLAPEQTQSQSALRLTRIDGSVATVDGPNGSFVVSVRDDVPGLGKIIRIGKRGLKAVLVATRRTLTAPWSQVATASAPLPIEIENDPSGESPVITAGAPPNGEKRRLRRRRSPLAIDAKTR